MAAEDLLAGNEEELPEDEMMMEEDVVESEDIETEEEDAMPDEGVKSVSLTADELPELEGLQIGDEIKLIVSNVSEDGLYDLTIGGGENTMNDDEVSEPMGDAVDELV